MPTKAWTTHLTEIRRDDDSERIGFLRPVDDDLWVPLNLLGMPLSEPTNKDRAENTVLESGMPSLMGQLWCKLPRPLQQQVTNARQDFDEAWWERVTVIEITSISATIRPYYPMEEEQTRTVSVQLPAHDVVKFQEPRGSELR